MSGKKGKKSSGTKDKEEEEFEPGSWECTVCTFRNRCEAFKCDMCDTRKGTSTRKPRLNPNVVEQQTLVQRVAVQQNLIDKMSKQQRTSDSKSLNSPESSTSGVSITKLNLTQACSSSQTKSAKRKPIPFRDGLVNRSCAKKHSITLNGVTFTITEFQPHIESPGTQKQKKLS
uniref:RanBP2-type domain-containing protein n=1 Tax=Acrobeloides nanus TaxID=290746 RepID=A0A914CLV5_9BILA